jgi:hypothetical protein
MKILLHQIGVFADFNKVVTCFTTESGPYNEGRGLFNTSPTTNPCILQEFPFEICYLLRHVERHARPDTVIPWSVRQMAIYQKSNPYTKDSSCIILQPSQDFMRRMQELSECHRQSSDFNSHWTCLHLLAIRSLGQNWPAYIKFLEIKIDKIVSLTLVTCFIYLA